MANDIDKKKDKQEEYVRQTGSLKERLARVKTTRWLRFGAVALLYVLWTIWMGNQLLTGGTAFFNPFQAPDSCTVDDVEVCVTREDHAQLR